MADQSVNHTALPIRRSLSFYLNGKAVTVEGPCAALPLAVWLRRERGLVGTKIVCNEGDCGACSVLVGRPNADFTALDYQAIDSCIAFIYQLDGCHVVTVEGLSVDESLTPVQTAMVNCHGSQCGFCTPGFVMTMHGMVEQSQPLNACSLRAQLSGNLCRCTGYVQILQAGEAIETAKVARMKAIYPEHEMLSVFKAQSLQPIELALSDDNGDVSKLWLPATFEQAVQYRALDQAATIVSGATDYGVLFNHGRIQPGSILCLSRIQTARQVTVSDSCLVIGALASWSAIEDFTRERLPEYYAILNRFGSPQIRRMGTIGGNLASGSPIADSVPLHMVLGAQLELVSSQGIRLLDIEDFYLDYRRTALRPDELIRTIITPLPQANQRLKLYKISKRRDMDISTVTMAIWAELVDHKIAKAKVIMGGVGATVKRLPAAEQALVGQPWSEAAFRTAGEKAKAAISPWTDVRGSAEYRSLLAENLMVKAYHDLS